MSLALPLRCAHPGVPPSQLGNNYLALCIAAHLQLLLRIVALQRRLTCNTPHLCQILRPISAFWRGATNKQVSRSLTFGGSIPTSDSNQPVRMPKTPDFFLLFSPFSFSSFDPRRHQRPLTIQIATAFSSSQSPPSAAASFLDTETQ